MLDRDADAPGQPFFGKNVVDETAKSVAVAGDDDMVEASVFPSTTAAAGHADDPRGAPS